MDVLFSSGREAAETLRHTSFAQPAIFAIEMGLARLWQSWGIEPDVVLGHSVGQYAAACVAGVFSLEDGARLIAERGRLFGSLPAGGRMVAVFADPQYVEDAAEAFPRVSVGAYNGRNTVLSGPGEDLEQIVTADASRPAVAGFVVHGGARWPATGGQFERLGLGVGEPRVEVP